MQTVIDECGGGIGIDWHGHRDRDLAIENSLAAMEAGATRLHGAAIGIGERVGNTPMDALIVNLVLMGRRQADLTRLPEYCEVVSEATAACQSRTTHPVVGRDAYPDGDGRPCVRRHQGVQEARSACLADAVYSAVPAVAGRPRADDRDRPDVRPVEHRVLAGEAGSGRDR